MKITYTFIMKVLPALLAALCWTRVVISWKKIRKDNCLRIPISATRKIWMLH